MAEARRFVIALVVGVLFLSSLPFISAESDNDLGLSLQISSNELSRTYTEGETILIDSNLVNNGEAVIYRENPACEVYMTVQNSNSIPIYSNFEQCRDQSRDSTIDKYEVAEMPTLTWDFTKDDGVYVDSGNYKITLHHSKMDLNDSVLVDFIKKPILDPDIKLDLKVSEINMISEEAAYLAQLFLTNTGTEPINLDDKECLIQVFETDITDQIYSCFSGTKTLHIGEHVYSGHVIITKENYNLAKPIFFHLYGSDEVKSLSLNDTVQNLSSEMLSDDFTTENNLNITVQHKQRNDKISIIVNSNQPNAQSQASLCNASVSIYNDFGELWVIDDLNICDIDEIFFVDKRLEIYNIDLIDENQCYIPLGKYTTIVQLEREIFSFDFEQLNKNSVANCQSNSVNTNFYHILHNNSIYTTIEVSALETNLRIDSECLAGLKLESDLAQETVKSYCGYKVGNFIALGDNAITFTDEFDLTNIGIQEDLWILFSSFNGIAVHENRYISPNLEQAIDSVSYFDISGTWKNVDYGQNECWVLNAPNSAHMVDASKLTSQWHPNDGWSGSYKVTKSMGGDDNCGVFGIPIVEMKEVYHESDPTILVGANDYNEDKSNSIDVVGVTITGTVSASIIVTLVLLITNTESVRIPLTSAGLWMLALVGKTHETSDGRFQRGRLIGYLTANPGCHFRALMAALNMSNGQITHHLRLLENQELIWRISDGRFVRYYPLNNSLYPGMNPDELPVPPLSPDPKSLQGKILTLLDDEHQIGEFPTQSELAKKLEKSQQLISHHLRTLQKYGLVEKRKMGIKNRYKLTKEALFLLETDIDYNKARE